MSSHCKAKSAGGNQNNTKSPDSFTMQKVTNMDHEVTPRTKDRILNTPAFIEKLGGRMHHATLRRIWQRGEIDPPMLIGGQNCWYESQANAYLARKKVEAEARQAQLIAQA
jgi:hypothetical protein